MDPLLRVETMPEELQLIEAAMALAWGLIRLIDLDFS